MANILIIDDDPDDIRLVTKLLGDNQFHVTQALSGEDGLSIVEKTKPDAVILDLFMPTMNGFMVLEKLRLDPELGDLPVIILTGADLTPEQKQLLADFSNNLMHKGSLNENELLSHLERSLGRIKNE